MLGRPSSMITALAVVPPMSKTMRSGSPRAMPRRAPPITPPAGPDATTNTGLSEAVCAASMPPFDVITRIGATIPALRSPASRFRK